METHLLIPLTQGKFAAVSPKDFARVSQFKWCISHRYAARGTKRNGRHRTIFMHRFVLDEPDGEVDHKDGNCLNNTRENLHVPTRNVNKHRRHVRLSASGFYGVSKHNSCNRFMAGIKINYKTVYLGVFDTAEEAARAYDLKALEVHGDNAMTNFQWQKKAGQWARIY